MLGYIEGIRQYIGHERLLLVGAGVFIHRDGRLLLQRRKDNGCWGAHGGACELGETVEETARRELLEETGLIAHKLELLGVFSGKELFHTYPNGDMVSNVNVAFLCEDYAGNLLDETDECAEFRWFRLDEMPEDISPPVKPALNRCLEVLKARMGYARNNAFSVEPIGSYRAFVDCQIVESWGGPFIVSMAVLHDTRTHAGFVALDGDAVIGFILYNIADNDCEITVLESVREGQGIGRALIGTVLGVAKEAGCRRMWLVTTNDNTHAIRFYQRFGFALKAVHIGAMGAARKLKPQIPATGNDGIPLEHEFEFERLL
jgi:8-oxo-dGTP pyrophosphatase MutT (NUDIX family)/GNAT superfamily N-acetyltransferase